MSSQFVHNFSTPCGTCAFVRVCALQDVRAAADVRRALAKAFGLGLPCGATQSSVQGEVRFLTGGNRGDP